MKIFEDFSWIQKTSSSKVSILELLKRISDSYN